MFGRFLQNTEDTIFVRKLKFGFERQIDDAIYLSDKITGKEINDIL